MLIVEATSVTRNGQRSLVKTEELMFMLKMLKLCQIVMNHQQMSEFILNTEFTQTCLSSYEVFDKFYSGNERSSGSDGIWQARINFYYKNNSTIGYTNKKSKLINCNEKYIQLNIEPVLVLIANLVHEYCHLVGLTHSSWQWWKKRQRRFSAPYAIGYEAGDLAATLINTGEVKWREL